MSDEQIPVRGIADFPEDLSGIDQKQIDGLKAKILKDFERIDSRESLDAEEMEHLAALNSQLKAITAEGQVRAEKRAEQNAMREQIRKEMLADTASESGEENAADEPAAETVDAAVEGSEAQAEVTEPTAEEVAPLVESIAASVAQRLATRTAPRPTPSTKVKTERGSGTTIIASSDTPGIPTGSHLSPDDLSDALVKRARSMGDSRGSGTKAIVASVERSTPINDIRGIRDDRQLSEAFDKAHNVEGLVASGGWCAPSETLYDFACDYEAMPSTVDLPTLTANRGGVRFPEALKLSDFIGEAGIGEAWTEATDILAADPDGPVKVCASIPCPDFDEVRLEAFYTCLKAGNLVDRAWPELVNRSRDLSLIAHAHRLNAAKIAKMVAAATAVTPTFDADLSATEAVLGGLEFEVARFRDLELTGDAFVLEAVAPRWLKSVIRRDIARRAGVDFTQVTDAVITAYFAEIGVRIQWVTNYQPLVTGSVAYPTTVEILFYPAGAFTLLDGGSLDIAVVRDSVLNSTNDHTLLFFEEFWQLLNRCGAFKVTIPICASGATGVPAAISCPSV